MPSGYTGKGAEHRSGLLKTSGTNSSQQTAPASPLSPALLDMPHKKPWHKSGTSTANLLVRHRNLIGLHSMTKANIALILFCQYFCAKELCFRPAFPLPPIKDINPFPLPFLRNYLGLNLLRIQHIHSHANFKCLSLRWPEAKFTSQITRLNLVFSPQPWLFLNLRVFQNNPTLSHKWVIQYCQHLFLSKTQSSQDLWIRLDTLIKILGKKYWAGQWELFSAQVKPASSHKNTGNQICARLS